MESLVFLVIFALIAVFAIAIPSAIARSKATTHAWSTAARSLGLPFTPPSFGKPRRMEGSLRGVHLIVDTFTRSTGKSSTTYTRYRARYPRSLALGLRLTKQGFFSGVGKLLGAQDISVGDAFFDQDVVVKGTDVRGVKAFLTPPRRTRIRSALNAFRGLVIDDEAVRWDDPRVHRDAGQIVSNARKIAGLAWFLASEGVSSDETSAKAHAPTEGSAPGSQAPGLQATRSQAPWSLAPRSLAPAMPAPEGPSWERLAPSGRPWPDAAEAVPPPEAGRPVSMEDLFGEGPWSSEEPIEAEASAHAQGTEPDSPVLEGEALEGGVLEGEPPASRAEEEWVSPVSGAAGPSPPSEESPPEESLSEESPAGESRSSESPSSEGQRPSERGPLRAVHCDAVGEDLFAGGRTTYDTRRLFEERHKGASVHGDGVLRSVDGFSYDYIFGSVPGAKALIEIRAVGSDVYGPNLVHAIVGLPPDAAPALRGEVGRRFNFDGTLIGIDELMRNLYVAGGKIERTPEA